MTKKSFSFIEAPIYQGQKHFGVSLGPSFIRQMLLDQNYDFQLLTAQARQSRIGVQEEIYEELSYLTEREARRNQLIFIAGGDHSLSIGSIQGLLRCYPNLKVLWIDAHGDINTPETSSTQSFHGMPLSFLLGISNHYKNSDWFQLNLKPENLIYFGLRDLDLAEKKFLDQYKIQNFSAQEVRQKGIETIWKQIQNELQGCPVHISLDTDAFDPSIAPSTGVPVQAGLVYKDVEMLIQKVIQHSSVKSFEYVELNPQIFSQSQDVFRTAQIGIDLFKIILQKHKQQGVFDGFNDRHGYSEKPSLSDANFQLEKQT